MGHTTDFDAADLTNQGRVVSGQWTPDVALTVNEHLTAGPPPVVDEVYPTYEIVTPAVTISDIVSSDEFVREAEAKTGSYLPTRPCMPTWEFSPAQEFRNVEAVFPGTAELPGSSHDFSDLYLRGWCIGVEFWDGMHPTTNLRIKRREGLELIPAPKSIYSPFSTPALPDDLEAKQVINEYCRNEPHAFPADFNDSGKMLPNILGGVANALAGLGIPLISNVAGGLGNLMKGPVGDFLGSLF